MSARRSKRTESPTAEESSAVSAKRSKSEKYTVITRPGLRLRLWKNAAEGVTLPQLQKELEFLPPEKTQVKVFGKWHNVPRRVSAYGDEGTAYTYAGGTLTPKPWTPLLTRLKSAAQLRTGCTFNFVLVKDGSDSMGKHRDNEPELDPATPVVSLSLGATRDFVLHRGSERLVLPLAHGELLAMDAPTNDLWHHSLPQRKKVAAPRLNLTFRQLDPTKATATAARAAKQRTATGTVAQAD